MFLKKEDLPIRGVSVVLFELTALQRLEYFEYLASLEASLPEDTINLKQQALLSKLNLNANVWLISRSLWHNTPELKEDDIYKDIERTWPSEAINLAVEKIMVLSDMQPKVPESEDTEAEAIPVQDKPLAK